MEHGIFDSTESAGDFALHIPVPAYIYIYTRRHVCIYVYVDVIFRSCVRLHQRVCFFPLLLTRATVFFSSFTIAVPRTALRAFFSTVLDFYRSLSGMTEIYYRCSRISGVEKVVLFFLRFSFVVFCRQTRHVRWIMVLRDEAANFDDALLA